MKTLWLFVSMSLLACLVAVDAGAEWWDEEETDTPLVDYEYKETPNSKVASQLNAENGYIEVMASPRPT